MIEDLSNEYQLVKSLVDDFNAEIENAEDSNRLQWISNIDKSISQYQNKIERMIQDLAPLEKKFAVALFENSLGNAFDAKTVACNEFSLVDEYKKKMAAFQKSAAGHYARSFDTVPTAAMALQLSDCFLFLKRKELAVTTMRLGLAVAESDDLTLKKELVKLDAWPVEPLSDGTTATSLVELLDRKGSTSTSPEVQRLMATNRGADPVKFKWAKLIWPGIGLILSFCFPFAYFVTIPWMAWAIYKGLKG